MRTLTATYNGDANSNTDVSPGVTQTVLTPTADSVAVGGRVLTGEGRGICRAQVSLVDSAGRVRTALSNSFGHFRIEGIPAGENNLLRAVHKVYTFEPQILSVSDEIANLNIISRNQFTGAFVRRK
jgi:hypothetical protein